MEQSGESRTGPGTTVAKKLLEVRQDLEAGMSARFYVLEKVLSERPYSWYEMAGDAEYGDAPKCPECGGYIGMLTWQAPRTVRIRRPRKLGDFVFGFGGGDMLVSKKFKDAYERSDIEGIVAFHPIDTVLMGRGSGRHRRPALFEAVVAITETRVLYNQMGVVWQDEPSPDYCRFCGPGGGGHGGGVRSWQRVVVDSRSWTGHDIFRPINLGVILLSGKAVQFLRGGSFANAHVIPCADYARDFYTLTFE